MHTLVLSLIHQAGLDQRWYAQWSDDVGALCIGYAVCHEDKLLRSDDGLFGRCGLSLLLLDLCSNRISC